MRGKLYFTKYTLCSGTTTVLAVAVDWTKRLRLVRVSGLQTLPAWGPPDHTAVAVVIVIIIGLVVIIGIVVIIKTLVIITIVIVLSVFVRVV